MRWKQKARPVAPRLGTKRVISRFQVIPRQIGGEWRWLEMVDIEQQVVERIYSFPEGLAEWKWLAWVDRRWA